MTEPQLERRLLSYVVADPHRTLVLAIATGLAVGLELAQRGELGALRTLSADKSLCERACEAVLRTWAQADRAGAVEPGPWKRLCDEIVASTRSS
jgi:hypothetical protein